MLFGGLLDEVESILLLSRQQDLCSLAEGNRVKLPSSESAGKFTPPVLSCHHLSATAIRQAWPGTQAKRSSSKKNNDDDNGGRSGRQHRSR